MRPPARGFFETGGQGVEPCVQVGHLCGLHQSQVATWQRCPVVAKYRTQPGAVVRQRLDQQIRMVTACHAIGDYTRPGQFPPVVDQTVRHRAEGAGHRTGIDNGGQRNAECLRQISTARVAVEQAHHALDQDQIGGSRGFVQQRTTFPQAGHPQIQLVDRVPAGALQDHRIEKVRPGFKHSHFATRIAVVACQPSGQ